jgi:hypothetical protein
MTQLQGPWRFQQDKKYERGFFHVELPGECPQFSWRQERKAAGLGLRVGRGAQA